MRLNEATLLLGRREVERDLFLLVRVLAVLAEEGDCTRVTLMHELIPDEQNQEAHESGWEMSFDNLEKHYATASG